MILVSILATVITPRLGVPLLLMGAGVLAVALRVGRRTPPHGAKPLPA